ncbi:MAG: hypothetical protein K2F91_07200, partial [Muribaculaceae bacterium]|nr:hypothetical protein [Muribaculaceae bacterium]
MKKLYTLLAAATVVASASAAAPQLHSFSLNTPKTLAPNARVEASAEAFENFVSSRAVGDVTPAYTHSGIYYSSIFGWTSEAFLKGEYDKVTNSVAETGQVSSTTLTTSLITVEGTKATIEHFADFDITIEGTYTPATETYPAYVTVKASEFSKIQDITDKDDKPTGEKICCYIYDTVNKKVSTDDVVLYFYDPERYFFWETKFTVEKPTSYDQASQRLVLANGTDPAAAGYKEYARTLSVQLDAVNSYMQFDAKFPGSTAFSQRRQYVWSETYTFTDDKNPALGEQTGIDVYNIFAV